MIWEVDIVKDTKKLEDIKKRVTTYHTRGREREKLGVIVHGLGVMGSQAVKIMATKKSIEIVGAVCQRKEKVGRDLGEVVGLGTELGVIVSNDADTVFSETLADVVLDATFSFVKEQYPVLTKALKAKLNFISIAEELIYPWLNSRELATNIDKLAKKNGVTVMATGINPGLALDAIPIFLSGIPAQLKKIRARRVMDMSNFTTSQVVMTQFGIGLTPEECKKGEEEGVVKGHVGLPETVALVADALGWEVEITETKEPLIAKVRLDLPGRVIEPGQVYGWRQIGRALKDGEEVIVMETNAGMAYDRKVEGLELGVKYWLEGEPNIEVDFVAGITEPTMVPVVTAARAINAIPYVVKAKPGLLSVNEVGVISYLS